MKYSLGYLCRKDRTEVRREKTGTVFIPLIDEADARYAVSLTVEAAADDAYIMIPACAYNGNRFEVSPHSYPPMLDPAELGIDAPIRITDVPALSMEGDSKLEVTAGDMTVPCVCVFRRSTLEGMIVSFGPQILGRNLGVTLEQKGSELILTLSAPAHRGRIYTMAKTAKRSGREQQWFDPPMAVRAGTEVRISCEVLTFACNGITELFDRFFDLRCRDFTPSEVCSEPFSRFLRDFEDTHNRFHYDPSDRKYRNSAPREHESHYAEWQIGWVGGTMNTLALMDSDDPLTVRRCTETLEYAARNQSEAGFFYGMIYHGQKYGDGFNEEIYPRVLLLRKHADAVHCMARQLILAEKKGIPMPGTVTEAVRKGADAIITLWKRYGKLGQFVDVETGELLCGASSSAAIAPAALTAAGIALGREDYITAAGEIAEHYYRTATLEGVTTGGPGEILQCPDSESAAALTESFTALYETVGDTKWLDMAEDAARQLSSWIVNYDYAFPETSRFGKMGVRTKGSVWANVQNKHSAPGLCTSSAAVFLKLFRATGDRRYLEIMQSVSRMMPQVASTEAEPITALDGRVMLPGEMCERVNMSDWETPDGVGDSIFGPSVWPSVAMALTAVEVPGIYIQTDTGRMAVSDHVKASLEGRTLTVENPTRYGAEVRILAESSVESGKPLGFYWLDRFRTVSVAPGESASIEL